MFTDLVPSTALLCLDVYLLACPLTCLTVQLLFFYWWLRSAWNLYWYYFSKLYCFLYSYRSLVSVAFSRIRTELLYWYRFLVFVLIPISVLFSCIVIYDSDIYCAYYLTYYYLTPDSCMLSPNTCLLSLITCHMIYYYLTCDYHISGILSYYPVLYMHWPVFLVLMYSCSSWTCYAPAIPVIW